MGARARGGEMGRRGARRREKRWGARVEDGRREERWGARVLGRRKKRWGAGGEMERGEMGNRG